MRERLSVSRQIQLSELVPWTCAWLVVCAATVLWAQPPDAGLATLGTLVVAALAFFAVDRLAWSIWPARPRRFSRPLHAILPTVLVVVAWVLLVSWLGAYRPTPDMRVRDHLLALTTWYLGLVAYLLWPPDPIAPPASVRRLLRLDENPPLLGR